MANELTTFQRATFAAGEPVAREFLDFSRTIGRVPADAVNKDGVTSFYVSPTYTRSARTDALIDTDSSTPNRQKVDMTLDQDFETHVNYNGEEWRAIVNAGFASEAFMKDQIEQARAHANAQEGEIGSLAKNNACRATGTVGTIPGSNNRVDSIGNLALILDDNVTPQTTRSLVVNNSAYNSLTSADALARLDYSGTTAPLRLRDPAGMVGGFDIGRSSSRMAHAGGTLPTGTVSVNGAHAVGDNTIAIDGGDWNGAQVSQGDLVTFAGSNHTYVVGADLTDPGTLTLNGSGLREAVGDNAVCTFTRAYSYNAGFTRDALIYQSRPPASADLPGITAGGLVQMRSDYADSASGFTFRVRVIGYKDYIRIQMDTLYGMLARNSDRIALLIQ